METHQSWHQTSFEYICQLPFWQVNFESHSNRWYRLTVERKEENLKRQVTCETICIRNCLYPTSVVVVNEKLLKLVLILIVKIFSCIYSTFYFTKNWFFFYSSFLFIIFNSFFNSSNNTGFVLQCWKSRSRTWFLTSSLRILSYISYEARITVTNTYSGFELYNIQDFRIYMYTCNFCVEQCHWLPFRCTVL